jgi:hypothetical protein
VSADYETIRSYQRIFRPERRIYQVEGHVLPVPGGAPLRWLAYAAAALVSVMALSSGSLAVPVLCGLLAAAAALALGGGREGAFLAGIVASSATWTAGLALGLLDWPLRLVVVPVAFATLATQAAPDGRRADRFAASWIALRVAPRRRSLGRALPVADVPNPVRGRLWVGKEAGK